MTIGWRNSRLKTKLAAGGFVLMVACAGFGCVLIAFWLQIATRGFPDRFGNDAYAYGGLLLLAVLTRETVLAVGSTSALSLLLHKAQIRGWRSKVAIALITGIGHGVVMYHWFDLLNESEYSGGLIPSVVEFVLASAIGVAIGTAVGLFGVVLNKALTGK
jgi:hypothetical protein